MSKQTFWKKSLSLLLALTMALSTMALPAFAEELPEGDEPPVEDLYEETGVVATPVPVERYTDIPPVVSFFAELPPENNYNDGAYWGSQLVDGSLADQLYTDLTTNVAGILNGTKREFTLAVNDAAVGYQAMADALAAFDRDHPEVYGLDFTPYTLSDRVTGNVTGVSVEFTPAAPWTEEALKTTYTAANAAITSIVAEAEKLSGKDDQLKYVHDQLAQNNEYNHTAADTEDYNLTDCRPWTPASALLADYSPVCEGYARAFKLICKELSIPCVLVSGTASGPHMWNYVQLDDTNWYGVDVTWDDTDDAQTVKWDYFLDGTAAFNTGRTLGSQFIKIADKTNCTFNYPQLSGTRYDSKQELVVDFDDFGCDADLTTLSATITSITLGGTTVDLNDSALTYQWYLTENGSITNAIEGATDKVLTLTDDCYGSTLAFEVAHAGAYNTEIVHTPAIEKPPITQVSATVAAPVKGEALATTVTVGDPTLYSGTVEWFENDTVPTADTIALAGKTYTARITLTPIGANRFDEPTLFSVNGGVALSAHPESNGTLRTDCKFLPVPTQVLTGITISPTSVDTQYTVGDEFNKTTITVTATYESDSSTTVTDYTVTGMTKGSQTLTISYTEGGVTKTATLTLDNAVKGKTPTHTLFNFTDPGLIYTGNGQQSAIIAAIDYDADTAGAATYSFKKGDMIVTEVKDAGTYSLLASVPGSNEYETGNDIEIGTFTVGQKPLAADDFTVNGGPYTGSSVSATISTSLTPTTDYTVSGTTSLTDVAEPDAQITFTGEGNYTGTVTKTWNLTPVTVTVSGITANSRAYVSGSTAAALNTSAAVLSGVIEGDKDQVSLSAAGVTATFDSEFAGTQNVAYTGNFTLTGTKAGNYTLTQPTGITGEITAAEQNLARVQPNLNVTIGGTLSEAVLFANISGAKGALTFSATGAAGSISINVFTATGAVGTTATVTATAAAASVGGDESPEYKATSTGVTFTVTVVVKDTDSDTMTVEQEGFTFGGTLPAYVLSNKPSDAGTETVTYSGTVDKDTSAYNSTAAPTEAGTYRVTVSCENDSTIFTATSADFKILPKAITSNDIVLGAELTYTGELQTQTVTSAGDMTTGFSVTDNQQTNAGTYNLSVTITGKGNYEGTATKAFTIAKLGITPTVDAIADQTFTGSPITPAVTVKNGTTALAADQYELVDWANNTDVGDASVTVKAAAGGNYTFTDVLVTFKIVQKPAPTGLETAHSVRFTNTATQEVDLSALIPNDCGEISQIAVSGDTSIFEALTGIPASESATFNLKASLTSAAVGTKELTATVTSKNYADITIKIVVTITDKDVPEVTVANIVKTYDGQPATISGFQASVPGTWSFKNDVSFVNAGANEGVAVVFTPTDGTNYAIVEKTISVTINKATVTVTALDKTITVGDAIPSLATPRLGTDYTVTGLPAGEVLSGTLTLSYSGVPSSDEAGTYAILVGGVTAPNADNYNDIALENGVLTVNERASKPSWPGRPGGGSSGSSATTEKNPDGSTTTTTEKKDGTVIETTKYPDGAETVVKTEPDGTVTTTEKDAAGNVVETVENPDGSSSIAIDNKDGSSSVTVIDENGNVTSEVELPSKIVEGSEVVVLPIPEIPATTDRENAPVLSIDLPKDTSATVEIPVEYGTSGTVVILVNDNGTEEILKDVVADSYSITLDVNGDTTVKIVDNSKDFDDVASTSWAADAVNFVSAREIFGGVTETTFAPGETMTRGMLAKVLHNLENNPNYSFTGSFNDVSFSAWYADAVYWAAERGIVDGYEDGTFRAERSVTREQLALMLWRYAGSPAPTSDWLTFVDADSVSGYANAAIRWAVENGIITGKGNALDPQGLATRAEVATMIMRFLESAAN